MIPLSFATGIAESKLMIGKNPWNDWEKASSESCPAVFKKKALSHDYTATATTRMECLLLYTIIFLWYSNILKFDLTPGP